MSQAKYLITVVFLFVPLVPVQAQTADEIVNKHVAATGGIEKWRSLQTLTIISRSEHFSFNRYWKRPNRIRVDVSIEQPAPGVDIRAFEGTTGWRVNPLEGSDEPRSMSEREIADLQEENDWLKELIDYKAKGRKVELAGKELIDGNPAYKLKLTKSGGVIIHIFLHAKTFLEVKRVSLVKTPWGADLEQVITIGDYRLVGGLMLPHRVGEAIREYEVNKPIDEAIFKLPHQQTKEQSAGKESEKKAGDLTGQVADPERRAQLLKANPEADVNKDGTLSLEEAWAFLKKDQARQQLLAVGSRAPEWTLKDAKGKSHKLSDYRGKVVVMDFWAVWCIPCHRVMPELQKLHNDLAKRGVQVLGISTGEHEGDPVRLMKDRGYSYELLLNGETIAQAYRVVGLPTIYVIGVDGLIIQAGFGANEIAAQRRRTFIEDYLTQQGR
jgi:peroxiredoxin